MERAAYNGKYVRVTEEVIDNHCYERIYLQDSLIVFPIDAQKNCILVYERRPHERPDKRWKPVTGFIEPQWDILTNANRELQEEIGQRARQLRIYFSVRLTGTMNVTHHFILATELEESKLPNPDGEASILSVRAVDVDELERLALSGEMSSGSIGYGILRLTHDLRLGKALF